MKASDSHARKGIETLARLGYTAKGVVYALVGILAAMQAVGAGGKTTGTKGAIGKLAGEYYGQVMLILMALGLAGFVVWRFTQAVADPERHGRDIKGIVARSGLAISGLIYAGLAVYTVGLLVNAASSSGGSSSQSGAARAMSYPGGVWAVAAVGVAFVGVGIYQAVRAYRGSYKKAWDTDEMSAAQERWASAIARMGLVARAVVFTITGIFLIVAAAEIDPSKALGSGGALRTLSDQPYGPWLLGVVAVGLACYGIYCFVNAGYRHINP